MTSEATTRQHPRPGVAYRPVRDAVPITVLLAWRTGDPPPLLSAFTRLVRDSYGDGDG